MFAGHTHPPASAPNHRAVHSDPAEPFIMSLIQSILLFNICCWYLGIHVCSQCWDAECLVRGHCQVVTVALLSNGIRSTNESVKFSSEMSCRCARLRRCLPNGRAGGPGICHAHYTAMVKPLIQTYREIEMRPDLFFSICLHWMTPFYLSHSPLSLSVFFAFPAFI